MEEVELGRTGRKVSRMGLGTMLLSVEGRPEPEEARRVVQRAVRLGVSFVDTADAYALHEGDVGYGERLVRQALDEIGAREVVVATKGGVVRPEGRWERDARPRHLRAACERSLRALEVESLDLYQLHAPDPQVPFAESVGELARLREEGKIRAVGLSNVTLDQLRAAQDIVEVASVQNRLNPWDRAAEEEGIPGYCAEGGITFIPFSPLGGRRRAGALGESAELREVAARHGATPEEVVLAWLLSKWPALVPIPGARTVEEVESSVRAEGIRLDEEAVRELEEAYARLPE